MATTQQHCIDACLECSKVCDMCVAACLSEKDIDILRRCIRTTIDCAEICMAAARMMARDSENQAEMCLVSAEICKKCEQECRKHAGMLDHCAVCADACARCAEVCRALAGSPAFA